MSHHQHEPTPEPITRAEHGIPPLAEQVGSRCVHFNGYIERACDAGVRYDDLGPKVPLRANLPCLKPTVWREERRRQRHLEIVQVPCSHLRYPTEEEVAEEVAQIEADCRRAEELQARGLSHCCEAPEDRSKVTPEDGGQVRCSKCDHRLYCERGEDPFW